MILSSCAAAIVPAAIAAAEANASNTRRAVISASSLWSMPVRHRSRFCSGLVHEGYRRLARLATVSRPCLDYGGWRTPEVRAPAYRSLARRTSPWRSERHLHPPQPCLRPLTGMKAGLTLQAYRMNISHLSKSRTRATACEVTSSARFRCLPQGSLRGRRDVRALTRTSSTGRARGVRRRRRNRRSRRRRRLRGSSCRRRAASGS